MPQKRRSLLERTSTLRQAIHDVAAWEAHFGSPAAARSVWQTLGPELQPAHGRRCAVWWAYTLDVPQPLRHAPRRPDPREVLGGAPSRGFMTGTIAWEAHERARLEWLLGSGHLGPGEVIHARAALAVLGAAE